MVVKQNSFLSKITAIFLVFLLMLPSIVKASHNHENDQHHDCKEKLTHLHESVNDHCDVCYFAFSSFNFSSNIFTEAVTFTANKIVIENYKSITLSFCFSSIKRLRAPPTIS
ncbi:hypothetical protein [Tenacibaculum finnmarkense]|uniref:hypothetical protein n=1 Tax=Tenacibaculum finnmarkense TaxID=2781243 RepID=UPI001E5FF7D2|nr:hypothetical protein [Tenacibaculum finnmarkense]MCD8421987.1 hypothetical protein [Tenacibaculum finnmarkense genomovar ulcerans]MCG8238114.1 hypothetical protein [Tenacibaculum finnmarkense genomovar ulcerans]